MGIGVKYRACLLLLSIVPVMSVFGFSASLPVRDVEMVGSGSATVKAPDVKITSVNWVLLETDPSKVDKAKLVWENFLFPSFIEPSWYRFYVSAGGETATGRVKVKVTAEVGDLLEVDGDVEYAKVISMVLDGKKPKPNKIELVMGFPDDPSARARACGSRQKR